MLSGALLALALGGCASRAPDATDPAARADRITRAVYADDLDRTVADFDDAAKRQVTRSQLGDMSDRMHGLGDLRSLTQRSADPDSGRYEYDAAFTGGALLVQLRIDPSGKIGAYRIAPETAAASARPTR